MNLPISARNGDLQTKQFQSSGQSHTVQHVKSPGDADQGWEFIKENKKTRKQELDQESYQEKKHERKQELDQENKKATKNNRKKIIFFLSSW